MYLFAYLESKLQVLANLANFAYDPVNYQHIRSQKVIDLFLEQLASDNNKLIEFAAAGLCNLVNGNNYFCFNLALLHFYYFIAYS
jgi:hypothetical protein